MRKRPRNRKPFDPLRAPLGGDLIATDSPDLFGVVLEEGAVELVPEAIDEKVLESDFRLARRKAGGGVAGCDGGRVARAQVGESRPTKLERIVEEAAAIEDPRQPRADQHDVARIRGGRVTCQREIA